mmetsp:Transcript_89690/g.254300  ORF Transcript_89690/g.254300 Transcript_89690/m.254300 type:complete len:430 (-) Transcript_89690:31-1320(-)
MEPLQHDDPLHVRPERREEQLQEDHGAGEDVGLVGAWPGAALVHALGFRDLRGDVPGGASQRRPRRGYVPRHGLPEELVLTGEPEVPDLHHGDPRPLGHAEDVVWLEVGVHDSFPVDVPDAEHQRPEGVGGIREGALGALQPGAQREAVLRRGGPLAARRRVHQLHLDEQRRAHRPGRPPAPGRLGRRGGGVGAGRKAPGAGLGRPGGVGAGLRLPDEAAALAEAAGRRAVRAQAALPRPPAAKGVVPGAGAVRGARGACVAVVQRPETSGQLPRGLGGARGRRRRRAPPARLDEVAHLGRQVDRLLEPVALVAHDVRGAQVLERREALAQAGVEAARLERAVGQLHRDHLDRHPAPGAAGARGAVADAGRPDAPHPAAAKAGSQPVIVRHHAAILPQPAADRARQGPVLHTAQLLMGPTPVDRHVSQQ